MDINNRDFLKRGLKTFGNSMYPLLLDGDILYLKKIPFKRIKTNDIITVKNGNTYFTHRVIYKGKDYVITKGDNNHTSDKRVSAKNILGIVENVKRGKEIFSPESLYLMQSSLYFLEIIKIKKILEKKGIDVVFLKGLPLHLYFEKTHPRRIYADCDILVKRNDFNKVKRILKEFGYEQTEDSLSKKHKQLKNKESEITFIKYVNGFAVVFDVHFEIVFLMTQLGELNSLYPQKLVDSLTSDFLNSKRQITVNGENFPVLSKDNLAVYLCLHLFHHNFEGTYRYEFINTVIKKDKIGENALRIIKEYKLENFIYPALFLLKKYYKTPVPSSVLNKIKPEKNGYMNKMIRGIDILNQDERVTGGVKRFKTIFFLSPLPFYRKAFVFTNKEVVYSVYWVVEKKIREKLFFRKNL